MNCIGDSGGPTYIQRPNGDVELIAVVSGVIKKSRLDCSLKNIPAHTWLYPHLKWIRSLMEKN